MARFRDEWRFWSNQKKSTRGKKTNTMNEKTPLLSSDALSPPVRKRGNVSQRSPADIIESNATSRSNQQPIALLQKGPWKSNWKLAVGLLILIIGSFLLFHVPWYKKMHFIS